LQQDIDRFLDLFLQTVLEVVMHLLDKVGIVEFGQDDFFFFIGHGNCVSARTRNWFQAVGQYGDVAGGLLCR